MKRVCTAAEVRALDHAVIVGLGVPGPALMETASRGVADAVRAKKARDYGVEIIAPDDMWDRLGGRS